mgnify:CR=1 FL=1
MARNNKRGQLTIFIILGIAILIILIILFSRTGDFKLILLGKNPAERIEECSLNYLEKGIEMISLQGGSINPENYYMYRGNKIEYICYNEESFQECIMQKPLLKQTIEEELIEFVRSNIDVCLESVKMQAERGGNSVNYKEPEISVELVPGDVLMNIELDLRISKGEESQFYKNVRTDVSSKLYDFVIAASSIANIEAKYGDSDTGPYMYKDKSLKVEKIKQDENRVYILTDRNTGEKFIFVIKSIPIPPGWIEPEKFVG